MTARDLITASLRILGSVAPGENVAASEAAEGLASLNRMIDSWSTEQLLIYARNRETPYVLTPGTATVTIGPTGNINVARPMWIESVTLLDAVANTEFPLQLLTQEEFASICLKSLQTQYPAFVYDDGGFPLRTLTLYPVPSAANKLILYTMRPLSRVATIQDTIDLPPGYEDALVHNLALRLAPEYGRMTSPELQTNAMETKAGIKRANHRTQLLRVDEAIQSRGHYNIYSGGYSRGYPR